MTIIHCPARPRPARSLTISIALICAATAGACGRDASADQDHAVSVAKVEEVSDSALLTVAHPEQFPVVTVTSRSVADRSSGTCVVSPDVNRSVPVNALGGGRVIDLKASLGDRVRKGQPLMTISSPDLSSAIADHLKAAADADLAKKQLDRAQLLLEHGSIARKDLETAQDASEKAQVDARATADRIRMLGGDPQHPTAVIELTAPIDGTIIEQNVTAASGVKSPDNAPNLLVIADLSRVWVLCDVYENDLASARVGTLARVRLNAYPEKVFSGRIGNISAVLDSATRTAKLRIEMDNAAGLMRPGMFAVAELESTTAESRLVLPTTALMQMHDASWVFVKVGPKAYRRVEVHGGREIEPGIQEILTGLAPGQEVVRNALQFVQTVEQ